ncbi:TPA: hypothetical protein GF694_14385 [Escherichia coli]|nr:hypothetical protein A6574_14335 [Escherichia coli]HAH2770887.1 hypothetical protein [Escherichia coli]
MLLKRRYTQHNVQFSFAAISTGTGCNNCKTTNASLYTQSLVLKQTVEVYFEYDRTLRKYGKFSRKLDIRKNSARR